MRQLLSNMECRWGKGFVAALLIYPVVCLGQLNFSAGYSYLHNSELDRVIQLFNTSREWKEGTLYPLTHTAEVAVGWNVCLSTKRQLHILPILGYGRTATTLGKGEDKLSTGIHRGDIGVQFRFHPKAILYGVSDSGPLGTRWFMTMSPSYSMLWAFVRRDGTLIQLDEKPYSPRTSSFSFSMGVGHHLMMLNDRIIITPEISAMYFPDISIERYTEAVNGHNILGMKNTFDDVFFFQARLRFTFLRKVVNWWDVPARAQ